MFVMQKFYKLQLDPNTLKPIIMINLLHTQRKVAPATVVH